MQNENNASGTGSGGVREKRNYIVITFHTTAAAMHMEKYCNTRGIPGRLIPVPRQISAGCGLAFRMLPEEYRDFGKQLLDVEIEFENITQISL